MKKISILILLIVLISFISGCASYEGRRAAPFDFGRIGDGFGRGFDRIEDFFTGGWQGYEKTMAFFIFFFLFYAAYLIGIKKIYKEEKLTRPYMVFSFVAAFLSAFIIAVSIRFDWVNLEYIAWFLLFILVLFLIHSLLLKMGMEKHKFWAFILALLITALLFWLIWYLMNDGRPLEGLGRVSDWFGGLGRRARVGAPGRAGPERPAVTPPAGGEVTKPPESKALYKRWWVLVLASILLYVMYRGGRRGVRRLRRGAPGVTPTGESPAGEVGEPPEKIEDIEKVLLDLLDKLIKIQEDIMKGFKDKVKHGILVSREESKGYNFPDEGVAWFYKEENRDNTKKILEEIKSLFEYNKKLIEELEGGLKLDVKEIEVLKYLAQELQREEFVLQAVREYHRGEAAGARLPEEQVREFEIKRELNERIRSEIIVEDEEMRKYLRQMLSPVLVRLYQLFTEFRDTIVREQNEALTPLNETVTRLLTEQEGKRELERGIKDELDSDVNKFITLVKEKEWIIYKNLEKDHDDKAKAKKDLKEEVWKRKKLREEEEKEGGEERKEEKKKEKRAVKRKGLRPYSPQSKIVFAGNPEDLTGMAWLANRKNRPISLYKLNGHYKWAKNTIDKMDAETKRIAEQVRLNEQFFGDERFAVPRDKVFEGKPFPRNKQDLYAVKAMNIFEVFSRMQRIYVDFKDEGRWNDYSAIVRRVAMMARRRGKDIGKFKEKKKRIDWLGFNNVDEGGELTTWARTIELMPKEKETINVYYKYIKWWQTRWSIFELGIWQMSRLINVINKES